MSEIDTYIGARLRAAREAADLSVRDVARQLGTDPDRLARAEEGDESLTARDLWLLSMLLHTSVASFFPGVRDSDLNDNERALLEVFRPLDTDWQVNVIESLRSQVGLIEESRAIEAMPETQKQQARYRAVARYLLDNGARVTLGPGGRAVFEDAGISAVLQAMPERERTQVAEAAYRLQREREQPDTPEYPLD